MTEIKIAVLSDTHDLLRPEALALLPGCACVLHAGDISGPAVLDTLRRYAPVWAVRGNNERGGTETLPPFLDLDLYGIRVFMTHKKKDLPADLSPYGLAVFGHSHQYGDKWIAHPGGGRTLLLNPGSCGPRRFHQPITLAMLFLGADELRAERVELPHTAGETAPKIPAGDLRRQIETVMKETAKGRGPAAIAEKHGIDPALTEQIVRLIVTHPGVTADGIMTKMGL